MCCSLFSTIDLDANLPCSTVCIHLGHAGSMLVDPLCLNCYWGDFVLYSFMADGWWHESLSYFFVFVKILLTWPLCILGCVVWCRATGHAARGKWSPTQRAYPTMFIFIQCTCCPTLPTPLPHISIHDPGKIHPLSLWQRVEGDKVSAEQLRLVLAGRCIGHGRLPLIRVRRAALGYPRPLVLSLLLWRNFAGSRRHHHPRSFPPPPSLLCAFIFHCRTHAHTHLCFSSDHRKTSSSR
jgi:hypothetical protein